MPESCFIRSSLLETSGFTGIFSLRTGGISKPPFDSLNLADSTSANSDDTAETARHNMDILLRATGLQEPHRVRQVHGRDVLACRGTGHMHREQADALLSLDGTPVAVRVADCTPVLIADPASGRCAAVHAGWRGTAQDVAGHTVAALKKAGSRPAHLLACIGPCIGPCCFRISAEAADALRGSCEGATDFITQRLQKAFADLAGINALQLRRAGLSDNNIERIGDRHETCTCCQTEKFFSYRRDGARSGRHLAIVANRTPA